VNKTVYGIAIGILAFTCSGQVAEAAMPYVSGSAALAILGSDDRSYDNGYALTGAVGLDNGQYRLEAELGYQKNDIHHSSASVAMNTYMANGYVDLALPLAPVKPFVVAGVGVASIDDKIGSYTAASDTVLAWQVGAGAAFSLAPLVSLDAQYRYFATTDPELSGHYLYSIGTHNVSLGLRVGF
jgi:opacity protein-like surface antigen